MTDDTDDDDDDNDDDDLLAINTTCIDVSINY